MRRINSQLFMYFINIIITHDEPNSVISNCFTSAQLVMEYCSNFNYYHTYDANSAEQLNGKIAENTRNKGWQITTIKNHNDVKIKKNVC